ncbi:MAG: hypothetical protein ABW004_04185 [Aeromicrobium sp.]
MAHLGADVAAYVDGQLSEPAMLEASTHLESCDVCERAVRQQRLLKSRMSTVATPAPPAALLASLAGLAAEPPSRETWWVRLGRAVPFRAGVVLVSASLAVIATAYVVGGPRARIGDEVAPPYDRYAANFNGPTSTVPAGNVMTEAAMVELDDSGWPCHETLAGDLHRVSGELTGEDEVISLSYSDGRSTLNLFEQTGVLDESALDGFESHDVDGSQVWVRDGSPTIVTWDDDGTVFTIVTDIERERIARAVSDLPVGSYDRDLGDRVGDGLNRMSAWISAA